MSWKTFFDHMIDMFSFIISIQAFTFIYNWLVIMSIEKCEHCDLRSQKSNKLTRHIEIYRVRLERERRIKSRLNHFIIYDHRKKIRKKRRNNNFDVDEKKKFISTNENFDDLENEIANEMIVNNNTLKFNDVFLLSINSNILSISFFLRIKNYEEITHRKIKTIINININDDDFKFMFKTKKNQIRIVLKRKELCVCALTLSKRK